MPIEYLSDLTGIAKNNCHYSVWRKEAINAALSADNFESAWRQRIAGSIPAQMEAEV